MFDIVYGWRKWKKQRVQWWIYVVGLGVITALFSLILQIQSTINDRDAHWKFNDTHYVTLAAAQQSGAIKPIQGYPIKALSNEANVLTTTKLFLEKRKVFIDNTYKEANILFYDENFAKVFNLPSDVSLSIYELNTVLVAEGFSHTAAEVTLGKHTYPIKEALPKEYGRLSGLPIDIFMPDHFSDQFNPFIASYDDSKAESIRLGMSNFYGVAITSEKLFADELNSTFSKYVEKYRTSGVVKIESAYQSHISNGIELKPKHRRFINRQLFVLTILFVCCSAIYIGNYTSLLKFQELRRQTEFRLKRNLGASNIQIAWSLAREQSLFIAAATIIALSMSWLLYSLFTRSTVFSEYFVTHTTFDFMTWTISFILLSTLFVVLSITIGFSKNTQAALITERISSLNKDALRKQNILIFVQITFAIVALSLSSTLFSEQLVSLRVKSIDLSTHVYVIDNPIDEDLSLLWESDKWEKDSEIAISAMPLFDHMEPALKWAILGKKLESNPVNVHFINRAALSLLLNGQSPHTTFDSGEVYINEAMADKMASRQRLANNSKGVIDSILSTEMVFAEPNVKVKAVVENQPHQGLSSKNNPYIYFPLTMLDSYGMNPTRAFIYCPVDSKLVCEKDIGNFIEANFSQVELRSIGNIESQLEKLNKGGSLIFLVGLASTVLISVLLFSGFYFQSKNIVLNKAHAMGIKIAIGANSIHIIKEELMLLAKVLLVSSLLGFFSLYGLISYTSLNQSIANAMSIISLLTVASLTVMISTALIQKSLKQSPSSLLNR